MRIDTVGELIQILEDYDEDLKVRVAFQPGWPLRARIENVVGSDEVRTADEEDPDPEENFLWIAVDQVSGYGENPYAPKELWNE